MDLELQGKRALVTGASRGLGAAIARMLASEGCSVVLTSRDLQGLESVKADINAAYPSVEVEVIARDIRDDGVNEQIAAAAGAIDILINNAGDVPHGSLLEIDEPQWRHAWDLKIFGYINLSRTIYGLMIARGQGVIINIIGNTAEKPRGHQIAVATGNAALAAFTRALGTESVSYGIRVVGVNPGATETDRQTTRWRERAQAQLGDPERWKELTTHYPFGRLARPEEIASVVTFLASPRAGYVSGAVLSVDGGGV
ncbi:short-chain dehydrogenase/reductase [Microvirga tunisiensis]|uniref:SDR family oxidoreductase n=1 Tax=Microvirga tunisiensis TaxID=2108360 RepID=A0A5N7M9X0_9HYPH|nr:short-chain dehydrogenase/reductase [Microvirga tunisiensis]MPR05492.1 SDR family oxidoreductase [Microvirga tunisiensis]MPR23693.1 SDR family oxidoreductase [Microvirga tunisiensis]